MSSSSIRCTVGRRATAAVGVGVLALGVALGACGDGDGGGGGTAGGGGGGTLTIYSSLPLQGAARAQADATVKGAKLALEQAGGKVGDVTIKFKSLDDSTAQAAGWEPGQTAAN